MSDDDQLDVDFEQVLNLLSKQADDIIDSDTDWVELGAELDPSVHKSRDGYPDWHDGYDFEPMFLAVLWAKTEDESVTGLSDRLEDNPEIADAFGFDPDDIPHGDTFARAWRNRFEDLQNTIEVTADQLDEIATERGSPIGPSGLNAEETSGTSKRTEQRLLRKRVKEVLDQLADVIFPVLDLPRPEGAIYDERDLLELMTVMGINGSAANEGATLNTDRLAAQQDIDPVDDPFYKDGMRSETLLNAIHQLGVAEITTMVNDAAERTLQRIKPYAEFPEPVYLAIDITYVAYYGDREEMEWVSGTPDHKQYDWCHKFATATLVGDGIHMVVGMLPVGNPEYRDGDAYPGEETLSYRVGGVVRKLMKKASRHVSPRCVYADREFASADTIDALDNEFGVRYMIPAPRNSRTKKWLERSVDVEQGILAVEEEWGVYGAVKGGASNERVETTLIGMPGDADDRQYGYGETPDEDEGESQDDDGDDDTEDDDEMPDAVPFYTNTEVDDEIALDRRRTKQKVENYNRRGGIETAFKKIKEFLPSTTSKDFSVRLFHFGFAVLLYNAWLMVDFLVQVGLDKEFRPKPRITAQRFINYVKRRLDRLI